MIKKGPALYRHAKELIPGGTQLLSKRPEMFAPDIWPAYYDHCKGVMVWDLDGNKYIDATIHGVGACILGYADPDVDAAVRDAIKRGTMCTLNCPEEVELAELLCELHPWAQKARFARSGGEALTIAIRIARAATGRDQIAFSGYHGWHDWYLAANLSDDKNLDGQLLPGLEPKGVPRSLRGSSEPFHYRNLGELETIVQAQGPQMAAIVLEPARNNEPDSDFLDAIRQVAKRIGAVLIFDEVTSGWRQTLGGIHLQTSVTPDMAVFAKGLSNGYPMAAIIGTDAVMSAAQTTFISSTYWTERIGPTAALATIKKLRKLKAAKKLVVAGARIQKGWKQLGEKHRLPLEVHGLRPLSHFGFNHSQAPALKTLFTQTMLEKGFLASSAFYVSCAHTEPVITRYLEAVDQTFGVLADAMKNDRVIASLKGPIAHSGFTRLT